MQRTYVYIYIIPFQFDVGWLGKTRDIYQGVPHGRNVNRGVPHGRNVTRCFLMLYLMSYHDGV